MMISEHEMLCACYATKILSEMASDQEHQIIHVGGEGADALLAPPLEESALRFLHFEFFFQNFR